MSQQCTKLTMHWYSSEVSLESCRHGYSWVKDNSQGDRLFISLLTDYRRYRAATLSTKRSVCNIRVLSPHSKWIRTDITHRQRGTDRLYMSKFVVQRSIDLALLLLTLLQGSSIEAVNPIKLCFLCLCQHSSHGNTQPRGCCRSKHRRTGLFGEEGTGAEDEGKKSTCFHVIDSCGQRSGLPDSKWHK